jgi:hypothetical protein
VCCPNDYHISLTSLRVCVCGAGNVKVTLADKENPSEVICQRQEITGIGDLKDVLSLRKINMSFNPISTLKGIDQLKELRHLSAYCCRLTNVDDLSGYVA